MSSGYFPLFVVYILVILVVVCANLIALAINIVLKMRLKSLRYDAARRDI